MTNHAPLLAAPRWHLPENGYSTTITRQSALDIMVRAALSQADRYRISTLPYPVEYEVFWQALADMGVNQERLMDRMGASP